MAGPVGNNRLQDRIWMAFDEVVAILAVAMPIKTC
jgi:hypothetical protein